MTPSPLKNLQPREFAYQIYVVQVPDGIGPDQVREPWFWQHVWKQIAPGIRIEVIGKDWSFWCDMILIRKDIEVMQWRILSQHVWDPKLVKSVAEDAYTVGWISPNNKYGVREKISGRVVQDGFVQKADAERVARDLVERRKAAEAIALSTTVAG